MGTDGATVTATGIAGPERHSEGGSSPCRRCLSLSRRLRMADREAIVPMEASG
jgi:hypothetical protein